LRYEGEVFENKGRQEKAVGKCRDRDVEECNE
jgi:hypothetical protein